MEQEQQNVLGASYAKKMISKVEGRVSEADPNKVITPEQQVCLLFLSSLFFWDGNLLEKLCEICLERL